MKEALQTTLILVVWIVFWLGGTFGGAVLQARLIDIGVVSDIDPPWIIPIGFCLLGFFVWVVFWLGGTFGGAVLQARLIDIGVVSDIDPPWIITIGFSFIGFFAGA